VTAPLFDVGSLRRAHPKDTAERATPADRRRAREAQLVAHGAHPLSGPLRVHIPLHPNAAPLDDRDAEGLRCGDCRHRQHLGRKAWPKCCLGGPDGGPRITHGDATDVRAYWPACTSYQPRRAGDPR
jgi:hypothetical protein